MVKSSNFSFSNSDVCFWGLILFFIIPFKYNLIPFILWTKLLTFSIWSFLLLLSALSFKNDKTLVWSFLFKSLIIFAALFIFFSLSFSFLSSLGSSTSLNKSSMKLFAISPNCSSFNPLSSLDSLELLDPLEQLEQLDSLLLNCLIILKFESLSILISPKSLFGSFSFILSVNNFTVFFFSTLSALSFNIWSIFFLSSLFILFIIFATLSIFSSFSFSLIYLSTLFTGTYLSSSYRLFIKFSAKSINSSSLNSFGLGMSFSSSSSLVFSKSIFLSSSSFAFDNVLIILLISLLSLILFMIFLYLSKFLFSAAFVLIFSNISFLCGVFKSFIISTALLILSSSIFTKCLSLILVSFLIFLLSGNKSSTIVLFKSFKSSLFNSFWFSLFFSFSLFLSLFIFSLINLLIYDFKLFVFFKRLSNLLNCSLFLSLSTVLLFNCCKTIFWSSLFKLFIAFATFFNFSSFSLSVSLFSALVLGCSSSWFWYKSPINPLVNSFNSTSGNLSTSSLFFSWISFVISLFTVGLFFIFFANSFILFRLFKVDINLFNFAFCFGFFIRPLNLFITLVWSLLSKLFKVSAALSILSFSMKVILSFSSLLSSFTSSFTSSLLSSIL